MNIGNRALGPARQFRAGKTKQPRLHYEDLEPKKVLQKLSRTPTTLALEPPCMSPSVPQAPDRW